MDKSTEIQTTTDLNEVPIQIMDEGSYQQQQTLNEQLSQQDAQARDRARQILKKCREGFMPNLVQTQRMLPYDGILASKAVLQLLELCLREDRNCPPGAREREAFSRPQTYAIARHCGKKLNFIGGEELMALVIQAWIPAFDQPNLSETWTGIGTWSGQSKLNLSND